MNITEDILYVGVNDHEIDLFEGQYPVKNGMSYNSYVILDEKTAVLDTVDIHFTDVWLDNVKTALDGRKPDYLIIHHMEPDHAASIRVFLETYPDTTVVTNAKAFSMIDNLFGPGIVAKKQVVQNMETLSLGKHSLTFVFAPMVHWPEVMVSYESSSKILFSADAFGKFGALDVEEEWESEARRYYFGIVGKFGVNVQQLLKKAGSLDIQMVCSLHGPVLKENISYYIDLYDKWSSYQSEEGIVIAYTSVYGHTKDAAEKLAEELKDDYSYPVLVYDLARTDLSYPLSDAFKYNKLVLATTTYNNSIFPFMNDFLTRLVEHGFQNRTVAIIENGSWAPLAAKIINDILAKCKNITVVEPAIKILTSLSSQNIEELKELSQKLCKVD